MLRQLEEIDESIYDQVPQKSPLLKTKGVYLLIGGLGGLGKVFAEYLAKHYQARLVLMGRRPLTENLKQCLLSSMIKEQKVCMYKAMSEAFMMLSVCLNKQRNDLVR